MHGGSDPSYVGCSTESNAVENRFATGLASEATSSSGRTSTVTFDVVVQVLRLVEQAAFLLLALVRLALFLAILLPGSVRV